MVWLETLVPGSLEAFLDPQEAAKVLMEIDRYQEVLDARRRTAMEGNSIHTVKGFTVQQAVDVFEPAGRGEIHELPAPVEEILTAAVARRMAEIRRYFPSAADVGPWFYAEYGEGQFITAHADQYKNKKQPDHPKIAAISVQLNDGFTGGEIFVETSGASDLWTQDDGTERLMRMANYASEKFRSIPRTRWTAEPALGTAYLIGSQVVHGTRPVTRGRVRKVISWINA
ncbi:MULTISPECIES: 2OG-Fe(II) oxygenase [unclassified Streptomyces]|uniref:2OG-Fe(II) oxygenase n=1 Tax=unclassified Streptomyces TaxID=2593676 RepID=UPI0004BECB5E|nr:MULTISPECIES: 2OG-Fe(II) oxygenase [unclassified Streptomyces]